jgi:hypothetical protein
MADPESALFVPLGSNAHALVDGGPGDNVEAVRRRLKFAAITFDKVMLEAGVMDVHAGTGGSTVDRHGDPDAEFQTDAERTTMEAGGFVMSIGSEAIPGAASNEMRPIIESENAIAWTATLQPLARELPSECDWIDYITIARDPVLKQTADQWRHIDQRNNVLRDTIPVQFVRNVVLTSANADLALGAHSRVAIMQDKLHRQVIETRFEDEDENGWQATGFALPIHMPDVTLLDWNTVAKIRNNKYMTDFRKILRDIETQALEQVTADEDIRDVVHRAFRRYILEAVPKVDGLGAMARDMVADLSIGQMVNVVTAALGPAVGIPVSVAMDAGPTAFNAVRGRKHRWTSVYQQLQGESDLARQPCTNRDLLR